MSNAVTLAELKAQVLDRADMTSSGFIDDTQLEAYINAALGELYDLLCDTFEDYFLTSTTVSVVSGTESYSLPSDFFKCRKVFVGSGDEKRPMQRYELDEVGKQPYGQTKYRIMGSKIYIYPLPTEAETVTMYYIPELIKLGGAITTISWNPPVSWEEHVVLGAAIRCLAKEESDTSVLERLQARRWQQMLNSASPRDVGGAARIVDVYGEDYGQLDKAD